MGSIPGMKAMRAVGDVVFPQSCWADGAGEVAAGLSDEARILIARLAEREYCRKCGLSTGPYTRNDFLNPCARCEERDIGIVHFARVGNFSEPLVGLVHRLKFARAWEVARVLAPFLYQSIVRVSEEHGVAVDAVAPVPLHWMRKASRGFNQAEELAREVAKLSGWRFVNALRRKKRTRAQARTASSTQRVENLVGAFVGKEGMLIGGKHVWLIDDVSTTGATLRAAAVALKKLPKGLKPASVNAAVICVTDHPTVAGPPSLARGHGIRDIMPW